MEAYPENNGRQIEHGRRCWSDTTASSVQRTANRRDPFRLAEKNVVTGGKQKPFAWQGSDEFLPPLIRHTSAVVEYSRSVFFLPSFSAAASSARDDFKMASRRYLQSSRQRRTRRALSGLCFSKYRPRFDTLFRHIWESKIIIIKLLMI